jgi:hypothetical protein
MEYRTSTPPRLAWLESRPTTSHCSAFVRPLHTTARLAKNLRGHPKSIAGHPEEKEEGLRNLHAKTATHRAARLGAESLTDLCGLDSAGRALAFASATICAVVFVYLGFAIHDLDRRGRAGLDTGSAAVTDFNVNLYCHNTRPFTESLSTERIRARIRRILPGSRRASPVLRANRQCNLATRQRKRRRVRDIPTSRMCLLWSVQIFCAICRISLRYLTLGETVPRARADRRRERERRLFGVTDGVPAGWRRICFTSGCPKDRRPSNSAA